jgi:hypothetical protein
MAMAVAGGFKAFKRGKRLDWGVMDRIKGGEVNGEVY